MEGDCVEKDRLAFERLRRRLAVAAAVLDREPSNMRKAATHGDIHHLRAGLGALVAAGSQE